MFVYIYFKNEFYIYIISINIAYFTEKHKIVRQLYYFDKTPTTIKKNEQTSRELLFINYYITIFVP